MTILDQQSLTAILDTPKDRRRFTLAGSLWGFGGAQGGLMLALLTASMRAPGRVLRRVTGELRRPVREEIEIEVADEQRGKTVSWISARANVRGSAAVTASAIFAEPSAAGSVIAPPKPEAPPPGDCPTFTIPPQFVPFSTRNEIRPVGSARPFGGATEPELMAWIRFVEDDLPPDELRLITLMDCLAPSYAAILREPVPIPTVTFTVVPGAGLARATSPWILIRARTDAARDGWLLERLEAWAPNGLHLGSAEQLRFVPN